MLFKKLKAGDILELRFKTKMQSTVLGPAGPCYKRLLCGYGEVLDKISFGVWVLAFPPEMETPEFNTRFDVRFKIKDLSSFKIIPKKNLPLYIGWKTNERFIELLKEL